MGPRRAAAGLSPAQLLSVSFLGLIAFGTLGLRWLPGIYTGDRLNWIDSLFTATSAACVTGLIVVDTATYFTHFGQAFILLLIQLGGLGILGLASLIIVALGARLSLRQDAMAGGGDVGGAASNVPVSSLVRDVLVFTLLTEAAGFVLLWGLWIAQPPQPDIGPGEAAWHALFHSISAFCNAGFSTFSDSTIGFQQRPLTQVVLMGGIVIGGLGFLTLEELKLWVQARREQRAFRLSLHTRLVLVWTLALILGGWVLLGALEWNNPRTLGSLEPIDKLASSLFLSVSPRTAGFNNIDYGAALPATKFTTVLLMSIGGAPGGTAGGVKVTTLALLLAMAHARLRARRTTDIWDRTVPAETVHRAVGLFAFAFTIVTGGILLLTVSEMGTQFANADEIGAALAGRFDFLDYMFEASSAFNTVGLSTGPTPTLSHAGRFLLIIMMFIGRVGPLTFAAALSRESLHGKLVRRYAHEDVVVG